MISIYKFINNIQTHLLTWGNPLECNGHDVIVCITGNPGVTDFYTEFGTLLHESTDLPVCVIGQAGHEEVPDKKSNELKGQEHLFDLKGQVDHKLDLVNNYIDKRSKIHLIGHSIGAWQILAMLEKDERLKERICSVNLLFPTLQRMAQSRNGLFLNLFLRKIHIIIMLLFTIVYFIPDYIRTFLVSLYLKLNSLPLHYSERILKYCNPKVGEKVLFLAYDEMDTVNVLNTKIIDKIKDFTNVIYSVRDGWAPVEYMDDLKPYQPSLQMTEVNFDHAFVLKSSENVAEMVNQYIKSKISAG